MDSQHLHINFNISTELFFFYIKLANFTPFLANQPFRELWVNVLRWRYKRVCLCVCVRASMHMCVCVWMCGCLCVYVCVCFWVHVHMFLHVCSSTNCRPIIFSRVLSFVAQKCNDRVSWRKTRTHPVRCKSVSPHVPSWQLLVWVINSCCPDVEQSGLAQH